MTLQTLQKPLSAMQSLQSSSCLRRGLPSCERWPDHSHRSLAPPARCSAARHRCPPARNEGRARDLYAKLLRGGDWSARVAALSWLGLDQLRVYFLSLQASLRPAITRVMDFLTGGVRAGLAASARALAQEPAARKVGAAERREGARKAPASEARPKPRGATRALGRLLFEVVPAG